MERSDKSRYIVPNLDRALSVFELLAGFPRGLTVSEMSEHLGIPKNSAFRISITLESRGYLVRDVEKRYRLTRKFVMLAGGSCSDENLFERSLDVMRRLRDATRETALIGVIVGREGVVLDQVPGLHPFRFAVDPGTRFFLHTAAPGKAILAFLPGDERTAILDGLEMPRFTAETFTDRDAFEAHLEEVAERGYAFDLGEELEGQYCVGAPIFDAGGWPIASLWITAPSVRLSDGDLDRTGSVVRSHADEISARFGRVSLEAGSPGHACRE